MNSKPEFHIVPSANRMPETERTRILENLGFGTAFTDHMVTVSWEVGKDWHDARVRERGPFQLDPATAVLHYAQEIFEGLKAYRTDQGSITLFRPEENARRQQSRLNVGVFNHRPQQIEIRFASWTRTIDAGECPRHQFINEKKKGN